MSANGIRRGIEDVAHELKGIKNILSAMWSSRYKTGETSEVHPEAYTDEYISTEECAKRLNVSDQTIRNWILAGKKNPESGWVQDLHYVNISPDKRKKETIRIPWNGLIKSFSKNNEISLLSFRPLGKYRDVQQKQNHIPNPSVPDVEDTDEE